MRLDELRQLLRAADPAAVLVPSRTMNRVIEKVAGLPAFVWEIPHRRCFVLDRHQLFRHAEQHELDLEPDHILPATVLMISRPSAESLANMGRDQVLVRYWRRLFHVSIDRALMQRFPANSETTPKEIAQRVQALGRAEFEEIRTVLSADNSLLPHVTDREVYIEFAAVFFEHLYFAPSQLENYFPGLPSRNWIAEFLSKDVDAQAIFERTKLPGAIDDPTLLIHTDRQSDESQEYYWRLVRSAERFDKAGNTVRAAILHTKAARVAPAARTQQSRDDAQKMLQVLVNRLQRALELTDDEAAEWLKDLPALLDKADQGSQPVEATILFELQKVCIDHEQPIYTLDLVEWALSGGSRPIRRPLPSQRIVRIIKHLRSAARRLTAARLADADRRHLAHLMAEALNECQERMRERFRPILHSAMQDAGLIPTSAPERNALDKIVAELLDRIAEQGFMTFSDLRDAISRNQLKIDDLQDAQEFIRGDTLLQLDRRLTTLLDGVYRRSEFYMRWLERITALNFGTGLGRFITRYITFPLLLAFLLIEGAEIVLHYLRVPLESHSKIISSGLASNIDVTSYTNYSSQEAVEPLLDSSPAIHALGFSLTEYLLAWGALSGFIILLIRYAELRQFFVRIGKVLQRAIRFCLVSIPAFLSKNPIVHRVVKSWPFQLFYGYLWLPSLFTIGLYWTKWVPVLFSEWVGRIATFLAFSFLLNTGVGRAIQELFGQAIAWSWESLRSGLIPGMVQFFITTFKRVLDSVEYVLFTVDEWLRFRGNESSLSLVIRLIFGVFWFPIAYLIRFYSVVLIEPMINPLKLPITLLAAKFVYPFLMGIGLFDVISLSSPLVEPLSKVLGGPLAWLFVIGTLYLSPDIFGFLAWELRENWRLYRSNRSKVLKPAVIGSHGETLRGFLRPGFHSGTIPKLFHRLREAEREAANTNNWRKVRAYRQSLDEVKQALRQFVTREFITLLHQSRDWSSQRLCVGGVALAMNRIRIELVHSEWLDDPVCIVFEWRADWLSCRLVNAGWFTQLPVEMTPALISALAALYKRAGLDFVEEHIRNNLPQSVSRFEIVPDGIELLTSDNQRLLYLLRDPGDTVEPVHPDTYEPVSGPSFAVSQLFFREVDLEWNQWLAGWQKDQEGHGHPRLILDGQELMLLPPVPVQQNREAPSESIIAKA